MFKRTVHPWKWYSTIIYSPLCFLPQHCMTFFLYLKMICPMIVSITIHFNYGKKKMQLCEGDEGCKFQTFFLILPFHFVFHRGKKIIKNDTRVSRINEDNFHFWVNRPFKSDFQSKTPLNDFKILTYLYYLLAYVVLTHVIMLLSRDTNPMSCDWHERCTVVLASSR